MSNQIVSTPQDLIAAVEKRFGALSIDLAANEENHKASLWLGPGGLFKDALADDLCWENYILPGATAWLNSPFDDLATWTRKCRETIEGPVRNYKILQLMPAQVCNNYVTKYINDVAYRIELTPRPFKKQVRDCMLIVWTPGKLRGIESWRWKNK